MQLYFSSACFLTVRHSYKKRLVVLSVSDKAGVRVVTAVNTSDDLVVMLYSQPWNQRVVNSYGRCRPSAR